VLKPGGVLLVEVPSKDHRPQAYEAVDGLIAPERVERSTGMFMYVIPAPMMLALLDELGFEVLSATAERRGDGAFTQTTYLSVRRENDQPPGYTAVWGFSQALQPMASRAKERLVRAGHESDAAAFDAFGIADPERDALREELARTRVELQAVLSTNAWKWGSRMSVLWNRLRGR
jgi:hypothetical protein